MSSLPKCKYLPFDKASEYLFKLCRMDYAEPTGLCFMIGREDKQEKMKKLMESTGNEIAGGVQLAVPKDPTDLSKGVNTVYVLKEYFHRISVNDVIAARELWQRGEQSKICFSFKFIKDCRSKQGVVATQWKCSSLNHTYLGMWIPFFTGKILNADLYPNIPISVEFRIVRDNGIALLELFKIDPKQTSGILCAKITADTIYEQKYAVEHGYPRRAERFCAECKGTGPLKTCAKCKAVLYCSRRCQKAHWDYHRIFCYHGNWGMTIKN